MALTVAGQLFPQLLRIRFQCLCQGNGLLHIRVEQTRIGCNRDNRRAQRKDIAAAVGDQPAVGRHLDPIEVTIAPL